MKLVLYDDVEVLAPPIKDVEWSVSYESKSKGAVQQLDSSEDESDDDWGVMYVIIYSILYCLHILNFSLG